MYLKIIGSLFLMTSAALIGFLKAEELRTRVKMLQEMKRMMLLLQGEFRFHKAELSEAFLGVSERAGEPFSEFLFGISKKIESRNAGGFEGIFHEESEKLLEAEGFCKEDLHLLELLQNSLGYLDLTMQTETLNQAVMQTEEAIEQAKKQFEIKGRLYRTMGVTVGALLTLIII